jgi:hypothetical protein
MNMGVPAELQRGGSGSGAGRERLKGRLNEGVVLRTNGSGGEIVVAAENLRDAHVTKLDNITFAEEDVGRLDIAACCADERMSEGDPKRERYIVIGKVGDRAGGGCGGHGDA